ncbi:MAG: protein phosphatase CheZ [Proteobacteria bacterium]|nr:protein phosphatase CheZ [Pseudomonadota bacterium]MBU1738000.1 protein phosphatase CheZ [Pseudomonadota bacterium]
MASNKPEINLEICNGTFRIPTDEAILNITVLGDGAGKVTSVVEKIVEVERGMPFPETRSAVAGDDYYKKMSNDIYNDIGMLAKSLSSTMTDIPAEDRKGKRAELDEAGEKIDAAKAKLKEIVNMTENATMEILDQVEKVQDQTIGVRELLHSLKDHKAFASSYSEGDEEALVENADPIGDEIAGIREELERAKVLAESMGGGVLNGAASEPPAPPAAEKKTRYLFNIDVIFQTMYELCTNETVKEHITEARGKAAQIIGTDVFIDRISDRVKGMEPDTDNFLVVPLSDVLGPLAEACNDRSVQNLMKNMDKNQGSIFLDQSLPLEMPVVEEKIGLAKPQEDVPEGDGISASSVVSPPGAEEIAGIINSVIPKIDALAETARREFKVTNGSGSVMTLEDQQEIFRQIEDAFNLVSGITVDSSKITEVLSFQDLSGQQIMKIIKLLTDFQIQLLGIVVSFGSQLKRKEEKPAISIEESKALAQEDVDKYLEKVAAKDGEEEDGGGMLDQAAVNEILEEMGF